MKFLWIALVALSTLVAAPQAEKPTPGKTSAERKKGTNKTGASSRTVKKSVPVQSIPADAEKLSDYEWRHTDKQGNVWIYRKTPFGIAKVSEEKMSEAAESPRHAAGAPIEVRDLGDSLEFSRKTPFGHSKWTKKKTELDEQEQAVYDAFKSVKVK